jgi:ATP-dependent protease Clp ATPase subunit
MSDELMPRCSFCGKSGGPKLRVIAGRDDVAICEECVRNAARILKTKPRRRRNKRARTDGD